MKKPVDIHDQIVNLRHCGEVFAIATVVRTISVTSAKAGAKALILDDGSVSEGWIGGGCAKAAVRKAAQMAISSGTAQLISIQPEELLADLGVKAGDEVNGICFAKNACPSEGTMDIFIEPVIPKSEVIIFGATPVACALSRQASLFGYRCIICCDETEQELHDNAGQYISPKELPVSSSATRFIVVATQGKGDEAGLKRALECDAKYIAFVGSRKKMIALSEKMIGNGTDANTLNRVKAPAGLDIGAITPEEISLSILAEMTLVHRQSDRLPCIVTRN